MVTEPVIFRAAVSADLTQIVALLADDPLGEQREQVENSLADAYVQAFAAIDADPNHELIVGADNNLIIAVLQLSYLPGLTYTGGWRAQIEGVRVARTHRDQGIGRELIEHAIDRARERPCVLVQLSTDKRRAQAVNFYTRLGFEPSHTGMKLWFDQR